MKCMNYVQLLLSIMPQIFQVLRCYKCSVFQVQQTKKDNKWVCKVCGEKQSVKRHYGIGTAKDCRVHVQKLNEMRGVKDDIKTFNSDESDTEQIFENTTSTGTINTHVKNIDSKWSIYIDKEEEITISEPDKPEYLNNKEVVLEVSQKRKIKRNYKRQTKLSKTSIDCMNNAAANDNENTVCKKSPTTTSYNNMNTCDIGINKVDSVNTSDSTEKVNLITAEPNSDVILQPENKITTIEHQKIKITSKWAQFVENNSVNENPSENNIQNYHNKDSLFSLCTDSDIDNILDF